MYTAVTREKFWEVVNKSEKNSHSTDYVSRGESIFSILEGRKEIARIHRKGTEETYLLVEES